MKILGGDLAPREAKGGLEGTLVLLDDEGRVSAVRSPTSTPALAVDIGELTGGEPFVLGVNLPVVVPAKDSRNRPIEGLVRRKLGYRLPPGGRAALASDPAGLAGEALLGALAAAGLPCLPYPDRDRRASGLAEIHPGLVLKSLLWETSAAASASGRTDLPARFRAYAPPGYRASRTARGRSTESERAATLDLILRALSHEQGVDLRSARESLAAASSDEEVDRAASLFDATLVAATARRYLETPETCLFFGDREGGYVILPADGLVRRLALGDAPTSRARLFPKASLKERLGKVADLRPVELLDMPGRPHRTEAIFRTHPVYEFDNLDEMIWWKHCRHVSGPALPIEGLDQLAVALGNDVPDADRGPTLRLVRSRHRTLSFRFEPPSAWRSRVPTRDGKTYSFRVVRAVFETLSASE